MGVIAFLPPAFTALEDPIDRWSSPQRPLVSPSLEEEVNLLLQPSSPLPSLSQIDMLMRDPTTLPSEDPWDKEISALIRHSPAPTPLSSQLPQNDTFFTPISGKTTAMMQLFSGTQNLALPKRPTTEEEVDSSSSASEEVSTPHAIFARRGKTISRGGKNLSKAAALVTLKKSQREEDEDDTDEKKSATTSAPKGWKFAYDTPKLGPINAEGLTPEEFEIVHAGVIDPEKRKKLLVRAQKRTYPFRHEIASTKKGLPRTYEQIWNPAHSLQTPAGSTKINTDGLTQEEHSSLKSTLPLGERDSILKRAKWRRFYINFSRKEEGKNLSVSPSFKAGASSISESELDDNAPSPTWEEVYNTPKIGPINAEGLTPEEFKIVHSREINGKQKRQLLHTARSRIHQFQDVPFSAAQGLPFGYEQIWNPAHSLQTPAGSTKINKDGLTQEEFSTLQSTTNRAEKERLLNRAKARRFQKKRQGK